MLIFQVIFKMDHAGNGILIEQKRLNEVMEIQSGHFTFDKFRYMCILSGCDYLASLSGIGLAKANKVFKIARQADIKQVGDHLLLAVFVVFHVRYLIGNHD